MKVLSRDTGRRERVCRMTRPETGRTLFVPAESTVAESTRKNW
jgi:hypothetical protein